MSDHKFETLAVHAGAQPDPTTGARATPIYQTTSFVFDDAEHAASLFGLQAFGNIYTRITNPTTAVLEERVAALESATAAVAVASGHSAQLLTFHTLLAPGDHFLAARQLYGGSINQFGHSFKKFGWEVDWFDATDPTTIAGAITPKTKAIIPLHFAGIPCDINEVYRMAKKHDLRVVEDAMHAFGTKIDGKKIDTSRSKTGKASYGHGNQLTSVLLDNEIKSTKQTFTIVGRTLFALPIRALASTVFEIAGNVTFSPEPNHIYVVKGLLKDDYSAVWIEDSSNQDEIVKKIEVNGSTELGFFEK